MGVDEDLRFVFKVDLGWLIVCETPIRHLGGQREFSRVECGDVIETARWDNDRLGTGPARLLDMVEGRSKQVFKTWLDAQTSDFRDGIEVFAMDGFTGFKTAAADAVPRRLW